MVFDNRAWVCARLGGPSTDQSDSNAAQHLSSAHRLGAQRTRSHVLLVLCATVVASSPSNACRRPASATIAATDSLYMFVLSERTVGRLEHRGHRQSFFLRPIRQSTRCDEIVDLPLHVPQPLVAALVPSISDFLVVEKVQACRLVVANTCLSEVADTCLCSSSKSHCLGRYGSESSSCRCFGDKRRYL